MVAAAPLTRPNVRATVKVCRYKTGALGEHLRMESAMAWRKVARTATVLCGIVWVVNCSDTQSRDGWPYGRDGAGDTRETTSGDARRDADAVDDETAQCEHDFEMLSRDERWDPDDDGYPYGHDNCPRTSNPKQTDSDGDAVGDACDPTPDRACPECGALGESCSSDSDCCQFREFFCNQYGECDTRICAPADTACQKDSHCCQRTCGTAGRELGTCYAD